MKPALKESLYLSLLVAVPLAVTALVGFGKDVNPHTDFDKKLASLDYVWTHGRWVTYYEKANKLAIAILDASTNANQNVAATKLMEVLLSKDFRIADLPLDDLYEHGVEDLGVMEKLAGYLESNTAATTEQHRANLWLVCRFLGKMRSEIVPGYRDSPCARTSRHQPSTRGIVTQTWLLTTSN
jgi:hypothetical protein